MMNADVTAENRPACVSGWTRIREECTPTYEYESGVQIFVVFLHEFLVVLLSLFPVFFVESSAKIAVS